MDFFKDHQWCLVNIFGDARGAKAHLLSVKLSTDDGLGSWRKLKS